MIRPRLVSLAGVSGAGKDTAGSYLVERYGFERVAIADPIKALMMSLFDLSREQLWGENRNFPDPRLGRSPRSLYQQFGRMCREFDRDVWIRSFRRCAGEILGRGGSVVCTDVRTAQEAKAVRELGGSVWLLRRNGAGAPDKMGLDSTEMELPALPDGHFDRVIRNDGAIADLHGWLDDALATAAIGS